MGRLPNFLYIGPDKAGSTWLHEVLIKHDQVWLTPAKDLYFFDRYFDRGIDWYAHHFFDATDEPIVGEICQDYLAEPRAPQRIQTVLGEPRLMVSLRDPARRAFSSYLYMRKHAEGPATFREALRSKPNLLDHGRYGTQLTRYLEHFERSNIHVAVFDDLQRDPQAFLDGVLTWLGIAPYALQPADRESRLPASRARIKPLAWGVRQAANVVRRLDGADAVGRVKRSPTVQHLLYAPLPQESTRIDPSDELWVREQLYEEVTLAESVTGVDLRARWGWN